MLGSVLPIEWRAFWYACCALIVASLLHGSATAGEAVRSEAAGPRGVWRVLSEAGVPVEYAEYEASPTATVNAYLGRGRRALVESLAGLGEEELLGELKIVEAELRERWRAVSGGKCGAE